MHLNIKTLVKNSLRSKTVCHPFVNDINTMVLITEIIIENSCYSVL